ncbi:MAG: DNA repair protein RecO [Phycisphaerae bacterium]
MRHRTPAICLRTTDYSETSQVVHFFTRDQGKVGLIAKGSKRPKSKSGGALDLLSEGDLVYSESRSGGLGTLIEFDETVWRTPLRQCPRSLHAALYMIELVGAMLGENDPHPEIYDLLKNALARLGEPDAPTAAVLAYFQWRLLLRAGLLGEMGRCVSCGREMTPPIKEAYFSSDQGGLLCGACEPSAVEKYRLDPQALVGLTTMRSAQGPRRGKLQLPEPQARAVGRLLNYHVTHQLRRPLRTARWAIGE